MTAPKKRGRPRKTQGKRGAVVRVPFHGEEIEAVRENGRVLVSVRRVCEVLDIRVEGQLAKLRTKPWAVVEMIYMTAGDGKTYETACIDLEALPMWLATLDAGRVKPELREKLATYQREAAQVLRRHFFGEPPGQVPPGPPAPPGLPRPEPTPRSPAERRLRAAFSVLDYVEEDLRDLPALCRWARDEDMIVALREGIHAGLMWVIGSILAVSYAREEPGIGEQIDRLAERRRRLADLFAKRSAPASRVRPRRPAA